MRVLISILLLLAAWCSFLIENISASCCFVNNALYFCGPGSPCDPEKCWELNPAKSYLLHEICDWEEGH